MVKKRSLPLFQKWRASACWTKAIYWSFGQCALAAENGFFLSWVMGGLIKKECDLASCAGTLKAYGNI
ncbi:MAG TPA: hypothetical protein DHV59_17790 [Oxalobacteraceae bacterium]|nr:hypothetical protein [Oxalobacteraceae bacterium]